MRYLALLCVTLLFSTTTWAGGYIGLRGGLSDVDEKNEFSERSDETFGSAALGTYLGPVRGEVEYTFVNRAKYAHGALEARSQRLMANAYIDIPVAYRVRPFIGAGVGSVFHKVDYLNESKNSTELAWQAGAGVSFLFGRNLFFDLGYRYVDMGSVSTGGRDFEFITNEVYAGFRLLF